MAGLKKKTIKSILHRKVDAWIASVEDAELREHLKGKVIVTGGCIVSLLAGEKVNDFDVYLRDKETVSRVAQYYVKKFTEARTPQNGVQTPIFVEEKGDRVRIVVKSSGITSERGTNLPYEYFESRPDQEAGEYVEGVTSNPADIEDSHAAIESKALETTAAGSNEKKYRPVFLTTNAITLSDKIQIVIRFYGEPDKIHENYDFVHCTNYWSSWDNNLVLRPDALEALLSKELRYVGSRYPICSLVRTRKFIERGWRINAGQFLKIASQISKLDLSSIEVLEDQLTGVDTAYFVQLIDRLKSKDASQVDSAYLVEIVDQIF